MQRLLPFVLASAVVLVYVIDGTIARSARGQVSRDGGTRERLPPVEPRARGRVERIGTWQNSTALPYDVRNRFVGAGEEVPGAAEIRVPLTDPEALRDRTTVLTGTLTDPESGGFRAALRTAVRSLPALVTGTAVQQTGEALVTAVRQLLG
ncbi:hypothetical protein ABZV34_36760 [Streptomyces sp. NPDC005195]|uniref:hypothetical protein n=1 Tax=Streptomyces sp. NPDC005195 TaxID=3154561 RepID=UPI0033A9AAA5